jgi:hypothetical protein
MLNVTKLNHFWMVFMPFSIQFWTLSRIRIRNLEFRIRIRQKVPDPCGSGSTTLKSSIFHLDSDLAISFGFFWIRIRNTALKIQIYESKI